MRNSTLLVHSFSLSFFSHQLKHKTIEINGKTNKNDETKRREPIPKTRSITKQGCGGIESERSRGKRKSKNPQSN